jgi:amidohydrolase
VDIDGLERLKERVEAEVDRRSGELVDVSHRIHARPELLFEEHYAAGLLCDVLEGAGLAVERGVCGLDTAFAARAGAGGDGDGDGSDGGGGGPTIAVLLEYDALPGIGHACGHNIIAAAGLGAGLAAASVAAEVGGRLLVLGTPAEEGGGGKVLMADRGAFEHVDAALMVHPAHYDVEEMSALAVSTHEVTYRGRAAHAAAFPWEGRNALDAAVLGYNAVAALRQHIRPSERVHGVFTNGGDKPNIVPELAVAQWYVRSPTLDALDALEQRVLAALEAGAAAAGCLMEHRLLAPTYADVRTNRPIAALYAANAARTGRTVAAPDPDARVVASTDMGNVSYLVPSIHPLIKVPTDGTLIHTSGFARWAASPEGDQAVVDGAKAMATTVLDLWARPESLAQAREAFAAGP